jgi:activator of HSP90 ATPase
MKQYKQHFIVKAAPQDVYAALTNPEIIFLWTGEKAIMSTTTGSEFEWLGGDICGTNIEFEQDKKIVQEWYFGEGETSVVTIKTHTNKKGTDLEINQTNIPDEAFENISEGWEESIVAAIKELLEE